MITVLNSLKNKLLSLVFCLILLNSGIAIAQQELIIAANQTERYLPLLEGKKIGIVVNATSVIYKNHSYTHLVDSLINHDITIKTIFSPEHGFRGNADAGEKVHDGIDPVLGLPIVSLYGSKRKPTSEQLKALDLVLFDIQDVGVRFYTYIATLQLVMQACAENNVPLIILDRPNPNAGYIDGPVMKKQHRSFLGMNEIPLVYGMTIGEYALMVKGENYLEVDQELDLTVIPLKNYTHQTPYHLPIKPSPNLPDDQAIALYPSLGLFEGTNVNAGRGTSHQFSRFGASFLDKNYFDFSYTPKPNKGSKHPKEEGKTCFGRDLSSIQEPHKVTLKWLIEAYQNSLDQSSFFLTSSFTRHSGSELLQDQIIKGLSEAQIRMSWESDINQFKSIRKKYLLYP